MKAVRKSMPLAEWPAADRAMLEEMCKTGGLFDDHGELAHLRPSTVKIILQSWGRFLDWLLLNEPTALAETPIRRASLPRLRAWLAAESGLRPTSRLMFFTGVLRFLTAAEPDEDWSAHRRIKARLEHFAGRGDPSRKAGRIPDAGLILNAALRHAEPSQNAKYSELKQAERLRDAAMVALLAMMPIRHRSFTALQIGASLIVESGAILVILPGELTKTGTHWEAELPEPSAGLLRRYMSEAREYLLRRNGKAHNMLWVCNNGNPMGYSYVGRRVPQITQDLIGVAVPPHFFRDAVATTLSRTSPNATQLIGPVLGHTDSRTSERHYIQAGSIEAIRASVAVLRKLKKGT